MEFGTVEQAIADIAAGKLIIVADDEDRENEGDLICAASLATPEMVNFMIRRAGGKPRPLTPERYTGAGFSSPDGRWVLVRGPDRKVQLYPISGGSPSIVPGLDKEDGVDQRSADGRFLYVHRSNELPLQVYRVEIATGRREPWRTLMPSDAAGVSAASPGITPDGSAYIYSYIRTLSDLYLVDGVK